MIKPPAMGVFARDPPSNARAGAPTSAATNANAITSAATPTGATSAFAANPASPSTLQPQPLPFDSRVDTRFTGVPAQASDDTAEDAADVDDDGAAQDDDDQGTVDEEAGIIRCICGCDDDDGFTIQCDRCLVWQHCACFGMSQASVPDEYLCEQCEPRPVDVAFAQAHQQKRKNNEARKALMDRNLKRQAQAMASNNFNQAYLAPESAPSPTSSNLLSSSTAAFATDDASAPLPPTITAAASSSSSSSSAAAAAAATARSRKPSHALDLTNTQFVVPEVPASAGALQRGGKQRKGQKGSRRGYDTPSAVSTPVRGVFTPGSAHERADDPFDAAEQLEAWHVEFTPIAKNVVADPSIIPELAAAMLDWEDGSPLKAVPGPAGRVLVPSLGASSIATSSRHLASAKPSRVDLHASSSSASSPSPASPRAPASPAEFESSPPGISAVGDECIPIELIGPSLADLSCRTYVKQISESASAGVFTNLLYASNSADEPQRAWCASRAFSRPVMHGLFAEASIPAGAFISELRGELYSATAYRNDPINQYAALGATKPHVHLLPPPLNLAIDARRFGSEARFARFSCHPNAVLRPILFRPNGQPSARSRTSSRAQSPSPAALLARQHRYADTPPAESRSEEPQLLFGLFALTDIPRTHEITLGWEWDDAHIVHFLPELVQNPYLESGQDDVDPSQHTANMVALAEKGEFPYADTEFSVKMSTVSAALLGCVLCACIGSAAPPGGGGGASSNNGRKQDCAVAQMLRVGNGMSLLNVTMPGKTNRSRARLPDFSPLVGARRFWRPYSLPPTPEVSLKDEDSPAEAALLGAHSSDAEAEMARLLDQEGEAGCGGIGSVEAGSKARRKSRARHAEDAMDVDDDDDRSAATDADDTDDARSVASSLTDPLSGLSDQETLSEGEDEELMDALRQVDGVRAKSRSKKGGMRKDAADADAELSGLFLLPPKKRSMRTRIKASMAPSDEEDGGDEHDEDQEQEARSKSRKSDVVDKPKSAAKRKGANRHAIDFSSDEDRDSDGYSATTPVKKRRKSGNIADPSSPLSSVPSPGSIDSSLSTPPPVPRLSAKHRLENERRLSDRELLKKKRSAKQAKDRKAKTSDSRPKESASKRRKREEARIHRNAILDLGDTESSEEGLTDRDDAESSTKAPARDDASERGSAASTPRASKVALPAESAQVPREAKVKKTAAVESPKSAAKDTPSKTKKVRRILSDSEQSSDDEGKAATSSPSVRVKALPQVKDEEAAAQPAAIAEAVADAPMPDADAAAPVEPPATATQEEGSEAKDAQTDPAPAASQVAPAPAAAPAPVPEVKKEEPRVKLSLAEYKRRLAERRVSEQQTASTSSASTAAAAVPAIATPTSEVAPSPSPAVEKVDPVRGLASVGSEPPTSEAVSAPAQPTSVPVEPRSPEKSASALPRGVLFTSIAAPTAIRSVEIPKSPSPEPPSLASAQQQGQAGVTAGGAAASSEASVTTSAEASAAAGAGVDTTRARAPSVTQQPVSQNNDPAGANLAASEGSVKPQTPGAVATTPNAASSSTGTAAVAPSAAAPTPSPTLGPTRYPGSRVPSSPSGPSTFNPPKAPRAFMSPPGVSAPAPLTSTSAAPSSTSVAAASASTAVSATAGVASTPARSVAGVVNTPSTASSSSTASSRYPAPGLTSPTPNTSALPGYAPRAFAGVPKGPASMRDPDPRADAWAEAREAREAREYPGARHLDTMRDGGRDMGWGERPREPVSDRDGPRGGWGRERRDMMHRGEPMGREPYARDGRFFGRDERDGAGGAAVPPAGSGGAGGAAGGVGGSGALGSRIDHAHAHAPYSPYRRPSTSEYDELHAGAGAAGYDPYNRGIVVRGRSLGLGGAGASAGPGGPPGAGGAGGREGRGEYRDYDDMGPGGGGQQGPPMGAAARGMPGFRSGWGGRSRPRGAPGGGGRGRGWMR